MHLSTNFLFYLNKMDRQKEINQMLRGRHKMELSKGDQLIFDNIKNGELQ